MVGTDTNVLVRWIVRDPGNPRQSDLARARLEAEPDGVHVNLVVLAETAWVLRSTYGFAREEIAAALRRLMAHEGVVVERAELAAAALDAYALGGAGLSDHLIGALNSAAGCRTTLTFDKRAAKGPHFTLLA